MKVNSKSVMQVVEAVLEGGYTKATKILNRTTKVTFTAKKGNAGAYVLTIGSPNYAEVNYIQKRQKAGLGFCNLITKG